MSKIIPYKRLKRQRQKKKKLATFIRVFIVVTGVFLTAFGLEMFLMPNQIIPGGIIGISGILSHVTEMELGVFLFFLNLPFIFRHIRIASRIRVFWAVFSLILLTILVIWFDPFPPVIDSPPLAAFLGSLMLGIGVGVIFRYGGFTDGVHQAAFLLKKYFPFSVGQIVMVVNLLILTLAGFIFGWKQAVYSIFGYMVSLTSSEYIMNSFGMKNAVWIKTQYPELVKYTLKKKFKKQKFTYMSAEVPDYEIFIIIPGNKRKAVQKTVAEIDPAAVVSFVPMDPLFIEEAGYKKVLNQ
ncbi:MAG: YitT family protein [Thermoactinomyces sp.]